MNKPLRKAFSEFKQAWQGEKKDLKIDCKEGKIPINGIMVVERDTHSWEVVWKVPIANFKKQEDADMMAA